MLNIPPVIDSTFRRPLVPNNLKAWVGFACGLQQHKRGSATARQPTIVRERQSRIGGLNDAIQENGVPARSHCLCVRITGRGTMNFRACARGDSFASADCFLYAGPSSPPPELRIAFRTPTHA